MSDLREDGRLASHDEALTISDVQHEADRLHVTSQEDVDKLCLYVDSLSYEVKRSRGLFAGLQRSPSPRKGGYEALGGGDIGDGDAGSHLKVLNDVSLSLTGGHMLAVLGSSGSGKTSLLDCISCRCPANSRRVGRVFLSGVEMTSRLFRTHGAYVVQDDTLLPWLTVAETLGFVAKLKLPQHFSDDERKEKVQQILRQLGLLSVADSLVGGSEVRGISGGEKRRVSIGVQLLLDPGLILLDEPTSGLDSHTAHHLVELLSGLASKGCVVVITIHQPRSDMYTLFDQVMILSRGQCTFCGPNNEMVDYFAQLGHPCPPYTNPLDEYVDLCSVNSHNQMTYQQTLNTVDELAAAFRNSSLAKAIIDSRPAVNDRHLHVATVTNGNRPRWWYKMAVLSKRSTVNLFRGRAGLIMRLTQMVLYSVVLIIFILRLQKTQESVQDRTGVLYQAVAAPLIIGLVTASALFTPLRGLMDREVRDGLYSSTTFLLSYLLHIFPFDVIGCILFSSVLYWVVDLNPELIPFVGFTAVAALLYLYGEMVCVLWQAFLQEQHQAQSAGTLFISFTVLLASGFLRNVDTMPLVLQYLGYGTIQKYASEILVANEYTGLQLECPPPSEGSCRFPTGEAYIATSFPSADEHLHRNYIAVVGHCVLMYAIILVVYRLRSYIKSR